MKYLKKILSVVFLIFALTAATHFSKEVYKLFKVHQGSDAEKLAMIWERDLDTLIQQKKLPPTWNNIREVVLIGGTKTAKQWLKEVGSPVKINAKGNQKLEILVLSWEDEGKEGAIVQYNLIDLESGNMTWELGRTFVLKDLNPASDSNKPSPEPISEPAESSSH